MIVRRMSSPALALALAAALFLVPNLAIARHKRPAHGHAHAVAAAPAPVVDPGPPPVVLDGKIPLPADLPPPPALADAASYVLMDFATGTVIAAKAPRLHRAPASLTKLMTVYLTYETLAAGTLKPADTVPVSLEARKATGSRMFIQPGLPVTVTQLISGLMIDSGNDAAVALAEAIGGTTDNFVTMMNRAAGLLHLADTHYSNVNGLPQPDLYTSALDVALLSRALIQRFPALLEVSKQQYFTYNNIRQRSWNPVLFRDATADGLKTGLTDESGHCVDATALRDGRRLIAVVMGGPNWGASTNDVEALLDYGYRFFADRTLAEANHPIGAIDDPLRNPTHVAVGAAGTIVMTLPTGPGAKLTSHLTLAPAKQGAIAKGAVVGKLDIALNGTPIASVPAVALAASQPAGFGQRIVYELKQLW